MEKTEKDHLGRELIKYSLPLIFSGLLQQLYNWADALIVGNVQGEGALAAIGSSSVIITLFVMAIMGFTSGISILSSLRYGQKDYDCQRKILFTFLVLVCGVFTVLSLGSFVFVKPLLILMDTPDDIFDMTKIYLQIILTGIPFIALYNVYASVLRGIGDSKVPFYAVLISSVLNIILDILFVVVFRTGVAGAAIASVISQIAMAIFIVIYAEKKYEMLRKNGYSFSKLINREIIFEGTKLALPITVKSVITSFGNLFLQGFMNSFGSVTVAAITSAYRVDSIIMLPIVNAGTAVSIYTSRSVGEGNERRARRCLSIGTFINFVFSIFLVFVAYNFGGYLVSLFGISDESILIGSNFFKAISFFYILFGFAMSMQGYLEGRSHVVFSGVAGVLALIVRIFLSYALRPVFDNQVIAYAEAFSWVFQCILFIIGVLYFRKKDKILLI